MEEARGPSAFCAERVRWARKARGWSQRQLAVRLAELGRPEITRNAIARLETGARESVTLEELLALAAALGVAPLNLMSPLREGERLAVVEGVQLDARDARNWVGDRRLNDWTPPPGIVEAGRGQASTRGLDPGFWRAFYSVVPEWELRALRSLSSDTEEEAERARRQQMYRPETRTWHPAAGFADEDFGSEEES
jgi:transcriptional regulator with XRE-family HTH domain